MLKKFRTTFKLDSITHTTCTHYIYVLLFILLQLWWFFKCQIEICYQNHHVFWGLWSDRLQPIDSSRSGYLISQHWFRVSHPTIMMSSLLVEVMQGQRLLLLQLEWVQKLYWSLTNWTPSVSRQVFQLKIEFFWCLVLFAFLKLTVSVSCVEQFQEKWH